MRNESSRRIHGYIAPSPASSKITEPSAAKEKSENRSRSSPGNFGLDRKVDQAEAVLRRAGKAGAPRQQVAQNLALIKALKSEMETDAESVQQ